MTRNTRIVLPALVALLTAPCALADPPTAATTPEPQPAPATIPQPPARVATTVSQATVNGVEPISNYGAAPDTKMICKTETPVGSRLGGHRVCMTKADWEKQSRTAQDFMGGRIGALDQREVKAASSRGKHGAQVIACSRRLPDDFGWRRLS